MPPRYSGCATLDGDCGGGRRVVDVQERPPSVRLADHGTRRGRSLTVRAFRSQGRRTRRTAGRALRPRMRPSFCSRDNGSRQACVAAALAARDPRDPPLSLPRHQSAQKGHPPKLCATTRRVPVCFAAARRWSRPSVRRRLVKANTRSNLRRSLTPFSAVISCTMTSGLAPITASRTAGPIECIDDCHVCATRRIASAFPGVRVRPRTEWPAETSSGMRRLPTAPVVSAPDLGMDAGLQGGPCTEMGPATLSVNHIVAPCRPMSVPVCRGVWRPFVA
jgi:hypothetical protein